MKNVVIETTLGNIEVELFEEQTPQTVSNFMSYVEGNYFDGTIFHRVIDGFMVQGGGFTPDMEQKASMPPIKNEASKELSNLRGTLAMARTNVIDSATSQFFINLKDNGFLDHRDRSAQGFGYCVFGKVVEGMDVIDAMAKVTTGNSGHHADVPLEPIIMNSVKASN